MTWRDLLFHIGCAVGLEGLLFTGKIVAMLRTRNFLISETSIMEIYGKNNDVVNQNVLNGGIGNTIATFVQISSLGALSIILWNRRICSV